MANLRIILVEDNEPLLGAFQSFLAAQGHQVNAVASAEAALALADENAFDLLVSDIQLTGMSGKSLYKELHRVNPALKAIFMSGLPEEESSPADVQHLQKPFKLQALSAAIAKIFPSGN